MTRITLLRRRVVRLLVIPFGRRRIWSRIRLILILSLSIGVRYRVGTLRLFVSVRFGARVGVVRIVRRILSVRWRRSLLRLRVIVRRVLLR